MNRLCLFVAALIFLASAAAAEPLECADTKQSGLVVYLDLDAITSIVRIPATVRNTTPNRYRMVQIEITVYHPNGQFLGLDRGFAKNVPAGGEAPFTIALLVGMKPAQKKKLIVRCEAETLQAR